MNFITEFKQNLFPSVTTVLQRRDIKKALNIINPTGRVLDVGSKNSTYLKNYTGIKYFSLDIDPGSSAEIIADIHDIDTNGEKFDFILAAEVLEHLHSPDKAIEKMHTLLKPGGTLLLTTRFMFHYHPDPNDYYRFTRDGLQYLLKMFSNVNIDTQGNRLHFIWDCVIPGGILNLRKIFSPIIALIDFSDEKLCLGYRVIATKSYECK